MPKRRRNISGKAFPPKRRHRRIAHGGGINGFSSVIIRLPEPNVTAIVLANNESVNAFGIGRDLLAIFYGERYTTPAISPGTSTVK